MKHELGRQMMKKFVGLGANTYSYLNNNDDDKKVKGIKKSVIKRNLKFRGYKKWLKHLKLKIALCKMLQFHLISWCGISPKTMQKLCLSSKF